MRSRFGFVAFYFIAGLGLAACSSSSNPVEEAELTLTKISPTQGQRGTLVSLEGSGFATGASVCFAENCNLATVLSDVKLTATAPTGSGTVDVSVRQDAQSATLKKAFTYTSGKPVDAPTFSSMSPTGGKAGDTIQFTGSGFVEGAQVCFGANCVNATIVSGKQISAVVPEGSGSVVVSIVIGSTRLTAGQFSYVKPEASAVDWCILRTTSAQAKPDTDTDLLFAELYEEGCTPNAPSQCPNLKVEIGYAPQANPNNLVWSAAERNPAFSGQGAGNNDEYMAKLKLAEGEYKFIYRASLDGNKWVYCDSQGVASSINTQNMGTLQVAPVAPPQIGWCRIMTDPAISTEPGEETPGIYAQVFVQDCTKFDTACPGLKAQIGYGSPALSAPDAIGAAYTWVDASFNDKFDGSGGQNHNEFGATLSSAQEGVYSALARFSLDGKKWTYCDTTDDNNFSAGNAVKWSVGSLPVTEKTIEWCRIQFPKASTTPKNQASEPFFGQAYVSECTGPNYDCPKLKAELGYGKSSQEPKEFTWIAATHNKDHVSSNNDEFFASITPTEATDYAVAYRFSLDGSTWTYCDFDDEPGFKMQNASSLNVTDPEKKEITWCQLWSPHNTSVSTSTESEIIYGQVLVPNCTGNAQCEGLTGYVGYGPKDASDPATFTWKEASYNPGHKNDANNEFGATLTVPTAGEYAMAYAFSLDGGTTKVYCDTNNEIGYQKEAAGTLTVTAPPTKKIDWCKLWTPTISVEAAKESASIYGQVLVQDCTGNALCKGLTGYVGYGSKDETDPSKFTWKEASYNAAHTGDANNEFMSTLTVAKAGSYALAYAFSLDGGKTKVYCDTNDTAGYQKEASGTLTVTAPATKKIEWCRLWHPTEVSAEINKESEVIYGQVLVPDCTGNTQCEGLTGYVGYGPKDATDPATFTWKEASYNAAHTGDANNEFMSTLTVPTAGSYALAYAFSLDGGTTKVYCDSNDTAGYQKDAAGSLTVKQTLAPKIEASCGIPSAFETINLEVYANLYVYGQIYIKDCTEGPKCDKVVASHFHYIDANFSSTKPIAEWTAKATTINNGYVGNNDEYMHYDIFTQPGRYAFAFSFDLKNNPSDASEAPQRKYCFINWQDHGYGTIVVSKH